MRIFQPMLFVGLGGTGGLVGAELERRLRAELCGPDGNALTAGSQRKRHQLPDCLQFVYADYSESELARLPHMNADRTLRDAYARTARATHDLLPASYLSSPDVTRMLRAVLRDEVSDWLPPREGEPKVVPLRNGAGQWPTVGRAALFGTLRNGTAPVVEPLREAIDIISRSGSELEELEGGPISGCDVFVAFSVAGGTGTGIFLDYLHLIGQTFKDKNFTGARIYPLVVMPSAFPEGNGGGRAAKLNAARAVVDLFRLVDRQNVPDAEADLGATEQLNALRIRYPDMHPIRLDNGTVPTGFLFSLTAGIRPDDLRRSMVSLVLSLIGTELREGPAHADDDYQTFAANFINRGVTRRTRAASGIGHRGVSTSLVASMTAPLDELAELVSARMLARAVPRLLDRRVPRTTENAPLVRQMFEAAGLGDLWRREAIPVPEPTVVPKGSSDIEQALRDRLETMRRQLGDLERRVGRKVITLAEAFEPRAAAERMLRDIDLFQLEGVIRGIPDDADPVAGLGFLGVLENRRQAPAGLESGALPPPIVPRVRGRIGGLSRPRWADDEVATVIQEQNDWYQLSARAVWHRAWNEQEPRWRSAANDLQDELGQLIDAFRDAVEEERTADAAKVKELYDDRTGVSYFLPPQSSLGEFYEDLMERLIESEALRGSDDETALLLTLVSSDHWQSTFAEGRRNPAAAVSGVKGVLKERVQKLFAESGRQQRSRPLMPSLGTLLSAAAGDSKSAEQVSSGALRQFGFKVAGLLPAGFTPEGSGPLKILITYPQAHSKDAAETYLKRALHLPRDSQRTIECRGVDSDTITVVLFRSEMSVTEVPEARAVLRQWARAQDDQRDDDLLRWRQRLGYQDDWLASTEEDREHILHRLLCAMWNGQLDCLGDPASPRKVRIRLHDRVGNDVPAMTLQLDEHHDEISSWASLLRAYEHWALLSEGDGDGDGSIVEDYCRELMRVLPQDLTTSGSKPSELYRRFVNEIAPRQLRLLEEREDQYGDRVAEWVRPLRQFWEETLVGALEVPFPEGKRPVQPNLRLLEEWVRDHHTPVRRGEPARSPRGRDEDWDQGWSEPDAATHERRYEERSRDDRYGGERYGGERDGGERAGGERAGGERAGGRRHEGPAGRGHADRYEDRLDSDDRADADDRVDRHSTDGESRYASDRPRRERYDEPSQADRYADVPRQGPDRGSPRSAAGARGSAPSGPQAGRAGARRDDRTEGASRAPEGRRRREPAHEEQGAREDEYDSGSGREPGPRSGGADPDWPVPPRAGHGQPPADPAGAARRPRQARADHTNGQLTDPADHADPADPAGAGDPDRNRGPRADGPVTAPTAGRVASAAAFIPDQASSEPAYAPYPDEPLQDPGWPGGESSLPWGLADSDGETEWDGERDSDGKGRGVWDGDPE
ncbi:tubulin-like doman-containing protein [Streptomyces sp. NPDC056500]|uniref:tubulin-like doman-containing protein n=1 Tax=Streptomyces sp. NPDC056500 TaxID=3345840 RepID=UPI0036A390FB